MKTRCSLLLFSQIIFFISNSYAFDDYSYEISAGPVYAWPAKDSFDGDGGGQLTTKLRTPIVDLEVSAAYLGKFDMDDTFRTYLEVGTFNVGLMKNIAIKSWLSAYAQAGLNYWKADLYFLDEQRGEDDGVSYWLGLGLDMDIRDLFHFYLGYKRHFDVTGSDINVLIGQFGVEF